MTIDDVLPEIFDIILEILRVEDYHKTTLSSCSVVSRKWRALTIKHVFYSLSFIVRIPEKPDTSITSCFMQDFMQSDIFRTVQSYVQKLALKWGKAQGNPIGTDILEYISVFPALRQLSLQGLVSKRCIAPSEQLAHIKYPRTLDTLEIIGRRASLQVLQDSPTSRRTIQDPRAFCDILSLFGSIRTLRLERMDCEEDVLPNTWHEWDLPVIHGLEVDLNYGSFLDNPFYRVLFTSTSLVSQLKRFSIFSMPTNMTHEHVRFVKTVALGIHHLTCNINDIPTTDDGMNGE